MYAEPVWIGLSKEDKTNLQGVIQLIEYYNLNHLSLNQLIEKLKNKDAENWIKILEEYNDIVKNIDTSQMLERAESIKSKFRSHGYAELENKVFLPRELLSLVILCYSNPDLIGPKLSAALNKNNENNENNIKKEILENSAYSRSQRRVVPSLSNLRLMNFALYSNNVCIQLPDAVLTRIKAGAVAKNITLVEINDPYCPIPSNNRRDSGLQRDGVYAKSTPFMNEPSASLNYSRNTRFIGGDSVGCNKANFNHSSSALIAVLLFLNVFKNLPVIAPVVRNISNGLAYSFSRTMRFFSSNSPNPKQENQKEVMENSFYKLK